MFWKVYIQQCLPLRRSYLEPPPVLGLAPPPVLQINQENNSWGTDNVKNAKLTHKRSAPVYWWKLPALRSSVTTVETAIDITIVNPLLGFNYWLFSLSMNLSMFHKVPDRFFCLRDAYNMCSYSRFKTDRRCNELIFDISLWWRL